MIIRLHICTTGMHICICVHSFICWQTHIYMSLPACRKERYKCQKPLQVCISHKEISLAFDTMKNLPDSPVDYNPQKSYLERIDTKKRKMQNYAKLSTKPIAKPSSIKPEQLSPKLDTKISQQRNSTSESESFSSTDWATWDTQLKEEGESQAQTMLSHISGSSLLLHQSHTRPVYWYNWYCWYQADRHQW